MYYKINENSISRTPLMNLKRQYTVQNSCVSFVKGVRRHYIVHRTADRFSSPRPSSTFDQLILSRA